MQLKGTCSDIRTLSDVLRNIAGSCITTLYRLDIDPAETVTIGRPIIDMLTTFDFLTKIGRESFMKGKWTKFTERKIIEQTMKVPTVTVLVELRHSKEGEPAPCPFSSISDKLIEVNPEPIEIETVIFSRIKSKGSEPLPGIAEGKSFYCPGCTSEVVGSLLIIDRLQLIERINDRAEIGIYGDDPKEVVPVFMDVDHAALLLDYLS